MSEELSEEESLKRTQKLLLKWKNDKNIQKLKEFYNTESFSEILGIERKEDSHSKFIAWILDDKKSHNLGQFAMQQLLDMLITYGEYKLNRAFQDYNTNQSNKLNFTDFYKSLLLNSYEIKGLKIELEKNVTNGRVDIVVSMQIKSNDIILPEEIPAEYEPLTWEEIIEL